METLLTAPTPTSCPSTPLNLPSVSHRIATAADSGSSHEDDASLCSLSRFSDPLVPASARGGGGGGGGGGCGCGDSFKSSEAALYTADEGEGASRDSYLLLSDSDADADPMFGTADELEASHPGHYNNDDDDDDDVPYVLHRRQMKPSIEGSKSCENLSVFLRTQLVRSRSFRCARDQTDGCSTLYARARPMAVAGHQADAVAACQQQLVRPKSIEFVSFQQLPPPDAFSSRDDTLDDTLDDDSLHQQQQQHIYLARSSAAGASFAIVVDVKRASLESVADATHSDQGDQGDNEQDDNDNDGDDLTQVTDGGQNACQNALREADADADVDAVYQDTLSSTSLEELINSDQDADQALFDDFVNDDDGLPDPHDDSDDDEVNDDDDDDDDYEAAFAFPWPPPSFPTRVLSRISEHEDSSSRAAATLSSTVATRRGESDNENTMSDVSSSLRADGLVAADDVYLPPLPLDDVTPVNEFAPPPPPPPPPPLSSFLELDEAADDGEFPSPPSSILDDDDDNGGGSFPSSSSSSRLD